MRIDYSNRAHRDLEAAIDNYFLVSERAANEFADAHDRALQNLRDFPGMGMSHRGGSRTFSIGKSGYQFVYRVQGEVVRILRLRNVRRARRG